MPRSSWGPFDMWNPDTDPGLLRMREALALRPTEESTPVPDGPGREERADVAPSTAPEPEPAPAVLSRREKVSWLVQRVQAGDLSAVAALRELLGG